VPVLMAALGRRACRLAGEIADGVIFYLKSADGVRQSLAWVREGAEAAGRDPSAIECVLMINVVPDDERARAVLASYARVPEYARSLRQQGFGGTVDAVHAATEHLARAVGDELVAALTLPCDVAVSRRRMAAFAAAGVDALMLLPTPPSGVRGYDNAVATVRMYAPKGSNMSS
jgi:alkanesulfonate monooxygenase SsuD/methylene tetrahydromethanopterin reductase-like flavin-dependent oxidoreductase (luciferase family)